ncbi:MAG: helicase-related protein [Methylococcales bacterium]
MASSGIRDNHTYGKVGEFLSEKIKPESKLSIVSAYFSIYGFDSLRKELLDINQCRFLFGEPSFIEQIDPAKTETKAFNITEDGLGLKNRLEQKAIAKACADWITEKVEIRSLIKTNLLHGKLYHIDNHGVEAALVGSSNFTKQGLGFGNPNIELNLIVDSDRDREDLKAWFDNLWNDKTLVKDVKKEVLNYLAQIYANHSPHFIYYKTLFHLFDTYLQTQQETLDFLQNSSFKDSLIWQKLFEFQKTGVISIIAKIQRHNGCILADSVGLGKTFEALAVIKYFEMKNYNVLVLCPKKLEANWTQYPSHYHNSLNPFVTDRFRYTVLCHTDLSRENGQATGGINLATFNWNNFDLVVIDESHNFRNDSKGKKGKTRYQRLLEDIIKSGGQTKVLLLSATPVNNDLMDLYNQIRFISADNNSAFTELGIENLKKTFKNSQKNFLEWTKQDNKHHVPDLLNKLGADFFKLLDELSIARSRKHIKKYYPEVVKELGGFPKRAKPLAIYPPTDLLNHFLSFEQLNEEIHKYKLALFNPSKYLLAEYHGLPVYQSKIKNFSQEDREYYLISMMKVNFLKRMESSIYSFALTMERTVTKIDDLINKIEAFIAEKGKTEFTLDAADNDDEELNDAFSVGKKIIFPLQHLDCESWLADLRQDKEQLSKLRDAATKITPPFDGKLKELKELIHKKVTNPTTNKTGKKNHKVLIFTAFADTADYLYTELEKYVFKQLHFNIALVAGSQCKTTLGKAEYNEILINFSPLAKDRAAFKHLPQQQEIDILIATDCISEGQNLQDCDLVINYDIHWNPVRLIQRFGRIDRINSLNKTVTMINFWATKELDNYLGLENRVKSRMALVDMTATGNDNLLIEDLETDIKDDLHYRDQQLKRMMNEEILDLEDVNNSVSLADFSLEDFRSDLSAYIMQNRDSLANAPLGLYAVVPEDKDTGILSGVIFCLQQKTEADSNNKQVNPLSPFFLLYIQTNGQVIYNFAQAKQILSIFKQLCAGIETAYKELCEVFDQQTQDGQDMTQYNDLLKKAIEQLSAAFQKREIAHLQTGRGAMLLDATQRINEQTDFNLVTWLIITQETNS